MNRVFVTGLGVVSPTGNDVQTFWGSLLEGQSGIGPLTVVDTTDLPVTIGGEIRNMDLDRINVNEKVSWKRMDRAAQFAVLATREALADAGLPETGLGDNCAVILGAGLAGLFTLQEQTDRLLTKGPSRVSPLTIPTLMPNAAAANVGLAYDITGPCYCTSSACSSSGHAMIDALEMLRRGERSLVVTGGTEASLTRLGIASFVKMRAMSPDYNDQPTKAIRPFDANRKGLIMSEGSAVLIFETEASLQARGVTPYAEVVGYGSTTDSFHLVQPDPEARGATRAIQQALTAADWNPAEIADRIYINAHGTGTVYNDEAETVALQNAFQDAAAKLQISSTKSMTGHLIGAACALEMVACTLALKHGVLPPTMNYETPDPKCPLDYIPNQARRSDIQYALNNSFGFGGHNVSLAMRKCD